MLRICIYQTRQQVPDVDALNNQYSFVLKAMRNNITIEDKGMHVMLTEMKRPLTNIILSAECLENDNLAEEEKIHLLKIILKNSERINNDIIELCNFLKDGHTSIK